MTISPRDKDLHRAAIRRLDLPQEYIDLAVRRLDEGWPLEPYDPYDSDDCSLAIGFCWGDTPEGPEFWGAVDNHASFPSRHYPLPSIPTAP